MSSVLRKIVFVYPYRMTSGGMPSDTRKFVAAVAHAHAGDVVLLSVGTPDYANAQLGSLSCFDLNSPSSVAKVFESLTANDITVFITFSSLINFRLSKALRARGLRYSVIPAWQVHDFLDWDRPFAQNAVPTIQSSEKNSKQFNRTGAGGVVEGRTTFRGFMRALKRKLYRFTLGKTFLQNTSGIHVFSRFEQEKITTLIALREPNFLHITFGTSVKGRKIGDDQYPKDDKKNLVFWGRADYFYKGLDTILDAIALAMQQGISFPFTFWIVGPDYNNGYSKLRAHVERLQIQDYVRILSPGEYTPGTIGLLKKADFSILSSRWDGHARALRESSALGVAVITNKESHFDEIIEIFANGLLFDSVDELATILANLNSLEVKSASVNAKSRAEECQHYLSWDECAKRFCLSLEKLI